MMDKTRSTGMKMLDTRVYTKPHEHSDNIQIAVRMKKEADVDLRAVLSDQVRDELPDASEETLNAIVTRKIYEQGLLAAVPEDKELTLKPDMSKTLKRVTERVCYHNGKYEEQKFSEKRKMAWSCCQSKDKDSEGCVVKLVDK